VNRSLLIGAGVAVVVLGIGSYAIASSSSGTPIAKHPSQQHAKVASTKKSHTSTAAKKSTNPQTPQPSIATPPPAVPVGWTINAHPLPLTGSQVDFGPITGVGCATQNFCTTTGTTIPTVAGDIAINTNQTVLKDGLWKTSASQELTPSFLHSNPAITGPGTVSCAIGVDSCSDLSATGSFDTYVNGQWYGPDPIPYVTRNDPLTGLSCPTASFCMATDSVEGASYTLTGGQWSQPSTVNLNPTGSTTPPPPQNLSCTSTSFCGAINNSGDAYIWQNGSWLGPQSLTSGNNLTNVSCVGSNFCVATDNTGHAYIWQNGKWGGATAIAGSASAVSDSALSCASTNFCMYIRGVGAGAGSYATNAYLYQGGKWTKNYSFANVHATYDSVSCPTTNFCLAGGQQRVGTGGTPYYATYRS
jgi:hypothetical protein